MRTLSPKGVLVGGIVDIIVTYVLTFPILIVAAVRTNVVRLPMPDQARALVAAMHASTGLYMSSWVLGGLCSILGGYVAARLARHGELVNGALSAYLCVSLGIYSLVAGHSSIPLWQYLADFLVSPALGAVGGYLRLRQTSRRDDPPRPWPVPARVDGNAGTARVTRASQL